MRFIEQRDAAFKKKGKQKMTLKVKHYCYGGWEGCEVSNLQIVLFPSLSNLITILDSETVVIDENTILFIDENICLNDWRTILYTLQIYVLSVNL